jgi:hypothetical protein
MSGGIVKHAYEQGVMVGDYVCHLQGWTTDTPTVGGWYWAWRKESNNIPDIVLVIMVADRGEYVAETVPWNNTDSEKPLGFFSHWLGPLPVPESPR